MTETPTRSARGDAARQNLLNAATIELIETGHLEVAAVAARAGVSSGLPYKYFLNRSGLLIALLDGFYADLCQSAALREYEDSTWAARERRRIRDWVDFAYRNPLAPILFGRMAGDGDVADAHLTRLRTLIAAGARNIAQGQSEGELPGDRDPEFLAAAVLGGVNALIAAALMREQRPAAELVSEQTWEFVKGAVGLSNHTESE